MAESEEESPSARKSIDIKEATSLFKDHIGVETTVTNAVRIDRKGTNNKGKQKTWTILNLFLSLQTTHQWNSKGIKSLEIN